jgi:hypothetical protein
LSVIVLNASIAVKWFLPSDQESLTTKAFALAHRYQAGEIEFCRPGSNAVAATLPVKWLGAL